MSTRRDFITLLGGAAAGWPLAARAQQAKLPVVGVLGVARDDVGSVRKAFEEIGLVEGRNVGFEFQWAQQLDQLPDGAAELVRHRVAVILCIASTNAVQAAKAATATIPIVFTVGSDPVALGLVASFNHPGGNVTGMTFYSYSLVTKRLELLRELVPQAITIAFLVNRTNTVTESALAAIKAAAASVAQDIIVLGADKPDEIDGAFATMARQGVGAVLVNSDAFYSSRAEQFVSLAARYRIPASFFNRGFTDAGGLMSYADDRVDTNRQVATYVARILGGAKPADLPVLQPTKFDLVINVKTAKALGLTVPPSFFVRADEVIE